MRWRHAVLAAAVAGGALVSCMPASVNTVAVSPDGKLAFAVGPEGPYSFLPECETCDVILADGEGKTVRRVTSNGRHNSWATFSPDGKRLLWAECRIEEKRTVTEWSRNFLDQRLVLRDTATGRAATLCEDEDLGGFLVFPAF